LTADEHEIRELITNWSKAVCDQNLAAICKDHDADILMFDVPPPFQLKGMEEYTGSWRLFFSTSQKPVVFKFDGIEVTAGADVAFATAVGHCNSTDSKGHPESVDFRLTMGLRKVDGRWRVMHEHHSVPAVS
jgi:uncharacterized protein (TIGR02246 family)